MDIDKLLTAAVDLNASDLHFSSDLSPWIRIDGDLRVMDQPVVSHKELIVALNNCMDEKTRKKFEEHWEVDFAYAIAGVARFRVNAFKQDLGIGVAFRTIPKRIMTLEELEMPAVLMEVAMASRGLVLVTGPTGCGKSTTLASMVDFVNNKRSDHVITIEDPIEYEHTSKNCLIHQRELYRDTSSFNIALRSALREDPDVILIGEMRDLETIRLALTAAETGHLVFGTLHTLSAAKTIARIVDVFPGEERSLVRTMLSESLKAVVSQVLVKRNGGGRIAATEIMIANDAIRNLIREDKLAQAYSTIQTGSIEGMHTLDQHLQFMVDGKIIEQSVARSVAYEKALFM